MRRSIDLRLVLFVLTTGLVASAAGILPAYAATADFTLVGSPTSATLQIGSSVRFTITMTSKGLQGTINIGITKVSQPFSNGLTFKQPRYDVWISPTSPVGTAVLIFSAAQGAVATTYTITITGRDITGGSGYGTTHTATLTLTVA